MAGPRKKSLNCAAPGGAALRNSMISRTLPAPRSMRLDGAFADTPYAATMATLHQWASPADCA